MNFGIKELKKTCSKYKYKKNCLSKTSYLTGFRYRLDELDAKLSEVFAGGSQVVSDDWYILFNMHDDRSDIGTLVTNMFHTLPWHLHIQTDAKTERETQCCTRRIRPVSN